MDSRVSEATALLQERERKDDGMMNCVRTQNTRVKETKGQEEEDCACVRGWGRRSGNAFEMRTKKQS